jgi:hypothetical protein
MIRNFSKLYKSDKRQIFSLNFNKKNLIANLNLDTNKNKIRNYM